MKRREFITLIGGAAAAWPLAARAQQRERMRRIGVLLTTAADDPESLVRIGAFLQGLQELGWTDARNMRIEYRWGSGGWNDRQCRARDASALAQGADAFLPGCNRVVVGGGHFERLFSGPKRRAVALFCQFCIYRICFSGSFNEISGRRGRRLAARIFPNIPPPPRGDTLLGTAILAAGWSSSLTGSPPGQGGHLVNEPFDVEPRTRGNRKEKCHVPNHAQNH
jgi:hypothetical protein